MSVNNKFKGEVNASPLLFDNINSFKNSKN